MLRNVLFKSKDSLALDIDNISFKRSLLHEIENYEQNWDIDDIVGSEVEKDTDKRASNNSSTAKRNSGSESDPLVEHKCIFISIGSVKTDCVQSS